MPVNRLMQAPSVVLVQMKGETIPASIPKLTMRTPSADDRRAIRYRLQEFIVTLSDRMSVRVKRLRVCGA